MRLAGLPKLTGIFLGGTQVTNEGLVHLKKLTNLRTLSLAGSTQITDTGLVHLKELTNLNWIILDDTPITDSGVAELKKALPNC